MLQKCHDPHQRKSAQNPFKSSLLILLLFVSEVPLCDPLCAMDKGKQMCARVRACVSVHLVLKKWRNERIKKYKRA